MKRSKKKNMGKNHGKEKEEEEFWKNQKNPTKKEPGIMRKKN